MREYVVGTSYRDVAAARHKEAGADEFLEWLNVGGRGMQAFGGVRWLARPGESPRLVVLVTSESAHVGNLERPWQDVLLPTKAALLYWGDARATNKGEARGNAKLRGAWQRVIAEPRERHALVLYFTRERKGWVTFRGLGHLAELSSRNFLDGKQWVPNELAVVGFLATSRVSVDWLRHWTTNTLWRDAPLAPSEYLEWVRQAGLVASPLSEFEVEHYLAPGARAAIRQVKGQVPPPPGCNAPAQKPVTTTVYVRDPAVRAWVALRSKGRCELCEAPAPFLDDSGAPFLEIHHVLPLTEGGPDTVDNAVALCPNCHRRVHHSADRAEATQALVMLIRRGSDDSAPANRRQAV